MKKFWRSGMIDKKVVKEREREEYVNKLQRTILELSRKPPEPKYAIVHTSDNRSHKVKIADDYDEVRCGDETILEFNKHIYEEPGEPIGKKLMGTYSYWMEKSAQTRCKADIEFGRKIEALENENNTRTL